MKTFSRTLRAAVVALASLWPALALPDADSLEENLLLQWTFGAAAPSQLSLSLRLEQPAGIGRALADFLGTDVEAAEIRRRWLPPLARFDWRSIGGCTVRVNGISLTDESGAEQKESGGSRTRKYLLGGAALVIAGVAVAGSSSSKEPDGDGGNGGCVCPNCDGAVSGFCGPELRPDDDGNCSTTCDTL